MQRIRGNDYALEKYLLEQDDLGRKFDDALNQVQDYIDSEEAFNDFASYVMYPCSSSFKEVMKDGMDWLYGELKEWLWDCEVFEQQDDEIKDALFDNLDFSSLIAQTMES